MSEPLDEAYLVWLYSQVASLRHKTPSKTYWFLLRQMYKKEFVWFVPNDDNRVEDGRELRFIFSEKEDVELSEDWVHLPCSMLEMLIALSRRAAFLGGSSSRYWFWHILDNVDLSACTDAYSYSEEEIDDILNTIVWRTYEFNGKGGLFPLHFADEDQTRVEIWDQLGAYLMQRYL